MYGRMKCFEEEMSQEWLLYACERSVEAGESEIEFKVASLLHQC